MFGRRCRYWPSSLLASINKHFLKEQGDGRCSYTRLILCALVMETLLMINNVWTCERWPFRWDVTQSNHVVFFTAIWAPSAFLSWKCWSLTSVFDKITLLANCCHESLSFQFGMQDESLIGFTLFLPCFLWGEALRRPHVLAHLWMFWLKML